MYRSSALALVASTTLAYSASAGQPPTGSQQPAASTPQAASQPATASSPTATESNPGAPAKKKLNVIADTSGRKLILKPGDVAAAMELKKLSAAGYKPE